MDSDLGRRVDAFFAADQQGKYRNMRQVVISVDGRIVDEKDNQSSSSATYNIQSMGSAIVAILVGMAVDDGRLRGLDDKLPKLLPSYSAMMTGDDRQITLRQLLTMTSGLDDAGTLYHHVWDTRQDWLRRILQDGAGTAQGTFGFTQDATGDLLVAVLEQATGQNIVDYAREKLFTPLGIASEPAYQGSLSPEHQAAYNTAGFAWPTDPYGHHLGVAMKFSARDLVKIGQLWLDKGRWQGRQLVSADWITTSRSALQTIGNENDGAPIGFGYGLFSAKITGHLVFAPVGTSVLIEVAPDLGLVVVVLARSALDPIAAPDPGASEDGSDYDALVSAIEPAIH